MFSKTSEIPPKTKKNQKSIRKKRKKQKQKNKKEANKIKQSLAKTMSSWAENFTMASTWQMKHQVAVWQARATALEYENQILRETLRQFYANGNPAPFEPNTSRNNSLVMKEYEQSYEYRKPSVSTCEPNQEDESDLELEISDEYMAFLRQNFEYRKARDERIKRQAEETKSQEKEEIMAPKPPSDRIEEFKELYGDSWQRIAALDCYIAAEFMSVCDSSKPEVWPHLPLRM